MVFPDFLSEAKIPFPSTADWVYPGLTLLLILSCWGLIVLCDRLMEDGK